jgi:hypothetical protein
MLDRQPLVVHADIHAVTHAIEDVELCRPSCLHQRLKEVRAGSEQHTSSAPAATNVGGAWAKSVAGLPSGPG